MSEFYNCNFKRDDIIIEINPENKITKSIRQRR